MRASRDGRRGDGPVWKRRDFLRAGGLGALGMTASGFPAAGASDPGADRALILLMLVGGPSQLETWDPKPDAPAEIRGPFGSIATTVPGVRINEHLPRMARRMDRLTVIRSLSHHAAPIHETGHQLVQTGRLWRLGEESPHVGSVVARLRGRRGGTPPFVVLPGPVENTGVCVSHGQSSGDLGAEYDPSYFTHQRVAAALNPKTDRAAVRNAYGRNPFGQHCLLARRLVEAGARVVTVNMFTTVFNRATWDCHGSGPFSNLDDYARELLPTLDLAFSALLDDLEARGLLETTLVVATGEFGRTPRINMSGGRDHWPGVWSAALAGGGTRGGNVIGASDAQAANPADRPVSPAELVATMYRGLDVDPTQRIALGADRTIALVDDARPIAEAFV